MSEATDPPELSAAPRVLAGRWVVVAMLLFGMTATGIMWAYWKSHVAPFLPLQQALADQFPSSRPRVEGGQRKLHKGTPALLRITMKVNFDPQREPQRAEAFFDRVSEFTRDQIDLRPYDELHLHLYWPEPEKEIRERTLKRSVSGLQAPARSPDREEAASG